MEDPTGFLKNTGVGHDLKSLGKTVNWLSLIGVVGVFLAFAGRRGHVLLDRELYLPKEWTDDADREILFDYPDDPTVEEIRGFLESLNEDEATELLALVWVGRGDFDVDEWEEAVT